MHIFQRQILFFIMLACFIFNNIVWAAGFVAGTPVLTSKGFIPIEQLKVGDKILCRNAFGFETIIGWDAFGLTPVNDDGDIDVAISDIRKKIVSETIKLYINDGIILEGASDHKVLSWLGWKKMNELNKSRDDVNKDYFGFLYPNDENRKKLIFGAMRENASFVEDKESIKKPSEVYDLYIRHHNNYIVTEKKYMHIILFHLL